MTTSEKIAITVLKFLREGTPFSATKIADAAGVSRSTVYNYLEKAL